MTPEVANEIVEEHMPENVCSTISSVTIRQLTLWTIKTKMAFKNYLLVCGGTACDSSKAERRMNSERVDAAGLKDDVQIGQGSRGET